MHFIHSHVNLPGTVLLFLLKVKGQKFIIAPLLLTVVVADSIAHITPPSLLPFYSHPCS